MQIPSGHNDINKLKNRNNRLSGHKRETGEKGQTEQILCLP